MTAEPRRLWYLQPLPIALFVLLALMAAIAASVGAYAWQRQSALAWIEQTHGSVGYGDPPRWLPEALVEYWPEWALPVETVTVGNLNDNRLDQLGAFRETRSLDISLPDSSDAYLRPLSGFYRLESLQINSSLVTERGLQDIAKCRTLKELVLIEASIGDEGLKLLAELSLERLDLTETRVTGAGMDTIAKMPKLRWLNLRGTGVDDAGVARLTGLPLESLYLGGTKVTDAGLAAMGTMNLRMIDLDATNIGDAGLATLGTWPALAEISLSDTRITDAGLAHLAGLPHLSELSLPHTAITDAGLESLPARSGWTWIDLSDTPVSKAGAERLAMRLSLSVTVNAGLTFLALSRTPSVAPIEAQAGGAVAPADSKVDERGTKDLQH